jgi:hypothetical protein
MLNPTEDIDSIKESLNEIKKNEYIPNVYDCSQFSRDLYNSLDKKNITSIQVLGFNDGISHCWVEANINGELFILESTNGEIYLYNDSRYTRIIRGFCF